MPETLKFDLQGIIPEEGHLQFLEAEVPDVNDPLVALIHYSVDGNKAEKGLRLDLNKQVFLDHFRENSAKEKALLRVAPRLIRFLYSRLGGDAEATPDPQDAPATAVFEFEDDSPLVPQKS